MRATTKFKSITKTYEVNGVKYDSINEMPEEYQQLLKDANNNGIPDIFESPDAENKVTISDTKWDTSSGKMPEDIVRLIESLPDSVSSPKLDYLRELAEKDQTNYTAQDIIDSPEYKKSFSNTDKSSCVKCGYNLAGVANNESCPVCGQIAVKNKSKSFFVYGLFLALILTMIILLIVPELFQKLLALK